MIEFASALLFFAVVVLLATRARPILYALLGAYILRLGAAIVNVYIYRLPGGRSDARGFESTGWDFANLPWDLYLAAFDPTSAYPAYGWFVALPYRLVGRVELVPHLVNVLLGTLIVFFVYKAVRVAWGQSTAVYTAWVAAVFPSFVHYSAVLLREVWIILPLTVGVYFFVRYLYQGRHPEDAIGAAGFIALSAVFHGAMAVGLLGLLGYFVWRGVRLLGWARQISLLEVFTIGFLAFVALPLALYWTGDDIYLSSVGAVQELVEPDRFVEQAADAGGRRLHGEAAYPAFLDMETGGDLATTLLPRVVYLLYSPFPWDISGMNHLLGFVDAAFYLVITYAIYVNWPVLRRKKVLALLLILVPLILAFAIGTSNFGTGIRHRAKLFSLLLIFSGGIWAGRPTSVLHHLWPKRPGRGRVTKPK